MNDTKALKHEIQDGWQLTVTFYLESSGNRLGEVNSSEETGGVLQMPVALIANQLGTLQSRRQSLEFFPEGSSHFRAFPSPSKGVSTYG